MKISRQEFASTKHILKNRYQGCGSNFSGEQDESLLREFDRSGEWWAEPKIDGWWGECHLLEDKNVFKSKNNIICLGLEKYKKPCLKPGTILICELGYGSQNALERKAEYGHDFIDIFDIVAFEYNDITTIGDDARRVLLENWWKSLDAESKLRFRLVPRFSSNFVANYQKQHEGLVLKKRGDFPYIGKGKKVKHWIKTKKAFVTNMVLMDWKESSADTKSDVSMVESLGCGQYIDGKLQITVWVGSMEHSRSIEFARNFSKYRGKVIPVGHYGQFKSGSLRHPFVYEPKVDEVMSSKRPKDCVFE